MKNNSKPKVGLVLAGGGGKGAYQIGVWSALRAVGLDKYITDVAGTSVGGLNAVLFAYTMSASTKEQQDARFNQSIKIWIDEIDKKKLLSHAKNGEVSFCSREGLRDIINQVGMDFFDETDINCYVTSVSEKRMEGEVIENDMIAKKYIRYRNLSQKLLSAHDKTELLLATSAMPFIYPKVKFENEKLSDGGDPLTGDNIPVYPLAIKEKCDYIIVIHLDQAQTLGDAIFKRNLIEPSDFQGTTILEIRPLEDNGGFINGTLDFSPKNARERVENGFNQTYPLLCECLKIITACSKISDSSDVIEAILEKWHHKIESIYYQEPASELERAVREVIVPLHDTKQLMSLMLECEAVLQNIKAFMNKREDTPFIQIIKRLQIKKQIKNKQEYYQIIAHQLQKQIAYHIADLYGKMERLMVGADLQFTELREAIDSLDKRVKNLEWYTAIDCDKTKDGVPYLDLPLSAKVLMLTRELFQLQVHQVQIEDKHILKAWKNLELPIKITSKEFFVDLKENAQYIKLLHFYEYDYDSVELSEYGRFFATALKMQDIDISFIPNNPFLKIFSLDVDFCSMLSKDLMKLHENYQQHQEQDDADVKELIQMAKAMRVPDEFKMMLKYDNSVYQYHKDKWECQEGMSEQFWGFVFKNKPDIIILPDGSPELETGTKTIIRMNDFIAFLWFRTNEKSAEQIAVLDCYSHYYYGRIYQQEKGKVNVISNSIVLDLNTLKTKHKMKEAMEQISTSNIFRTFPTINNKVNNPDNYKDKVIPLLTFLNGEEGKAILADLLKHFEISFDLECL